jgi:hypothetical protein
MRVCAGTSGYAVTYFTPTISRRVGYSAACAQVMCISVHITSAVFTDFIAQKSAHF